MQSPQTKKTLSYIYKICVDHDDHDDHDVNKFNSSVSDSEQISKILDTLKYNLNQGKISLPLVTKVKQHSFITLLNHKRKKNSHVNMNTIVSDGYKTYIYVYIYIFGKKFKYSFNFPIFFTIVEYENHNKLYNLVS